jgi:hypothetical protein
MKVALLLAGLLTFGLTAFGQETNATVIPPHSTIYIHPMEGFEVYLAAAFQKKKVPLLIVADRDRADFEVTGNSEMKKAGWAKTIFGSGRAEVNASVQVINIKTGVVAYAVASHKNDAWRGYKSAAEHIAKNLRQKIERDARAKR